MRFGVSAAVVAASVLGSNMAWSACLPGQSHNCVNLDLVPQISQQIVAGEHVAAPPKAAPDGALVAAPSSNYTGPTLGPTVGVDQAVRRAPTVGYRWSID